MLGQRPPGSACIFNEAVASFLLASELSSIGLSGFKLLCGCSGIRLLARSCLICLSLLLLEGFIFLNFSVLFSTSEQNAISVCLSVYRPLDITLLLGENSEQSHSLAPCIKGLTKARLECENSFTPAGRGSLASWMMRRSTSPWKGWEKPGLPSPEAFHGYSVEHLRTLIGGFVLWQGRSDTVLSSFGDVSLLSRRVRSRTCCWLRSAEDFSDAVLISPSLAYSACCYTEIFFYFFSNFYEGIRRWCGTIFDRLFTCVLLCI